MDNQGNRVAIWIAALGMASTLASGAIGYRSGSNAIDKDYVQIATDLLKQKDTSPELRAWSANVLENLSPVPFTIKLKNELSDNGFSKTKLIPPSQIPMPESAALCPDLLARYPNPNDLTFRTLIMAYQDCRINHENFVKFINSINKNNKAENSK